MKGPIVASGHAESVAGMIGAIRDQAGGHWFGRTIAIPDKRR